MIPTDPCELFVQMTLAERYGITLQKIKETGTEKVADFELLDSGTRVAVVEVKNLEAVEPNETQGWAKDGVFWTRTDNGPSRVSSCIHKAWQQLKTYEDPKVLVLVSDGDVDVKDLDEACKGYLDYGEGRAVLRNIASMRIAQGRIVGEKGKIDLYVWINRHLFDRSSVLEFCALRGPLHREIAHADRVQFRITSSTGENLIRTHFGLEMPGSTQ